MFFRYQFHVDNQTLSRYTPSDTLRYFAKGKATLRATSLKEGGFWNADAMVPYACPRANSLSLPLFSYMRSSARLNTSSTMPSPW